MSTCFPRKKACSVTSAQILAILAFAFAATSTGFFIWLFLPLGVAVTLATMAHGGCLAMFLVPWCRPVGSQFLRRVGRAAIIEGIAMFPIGSMMAFMGFIGCCRVVPFGVAAFVGGGCWIAAGRVFWTVSWDDERNEAAAEPASDVELVHAEVVQPDQPEMKA